MEVPVQADYTAMWLHGAKPRRLTPYTWLSFRAERSCRELQLPGPFFDDTRTRQELGRTE